MPSLVFLAALPAFLLSLVGTAVIRRLAPRIGLLDHPSARKVHHNPMPLGGGIAIWFAMTASLVGVLLLAALGEHSPVVRAWIPEALLPYLSGVLAQSYRLAALLGAGTLLMVMGLLDDLRNLGYRSRLFVQFALAAALAASGIRLTLFIPDGWLPFAATVVWLVVLINAFNFLDNMDALSSGVALIAAGLLALVMLQAGDQPHFFVAGLLAVLVGALAGFLVHNWPPARIFMGDAGSGFIGLMLGAGTILGTFHEPGLPRHAIVAPLCILAVPLYDVASVVLIRLAEGRSPFLPDKSHFSHRLVELGLSKTSAVLTIHLATLATGLGALLLYQVPHWTGAVVVFAVVVCVLGVIAILETAARRRANSIERPPQV